MSRRESTAIPFEPCPIKIRYAARADAQQIASILTSAFPGLIASIFLTTSRERCIEMLAETVREGIVSIDTILVAEKANLVVGVAILQVRSPIVRGSYKRFFEVIRNRAGHTRAVLACIGGFQYRVFDSRTPYAPDLAYIEAIAVSELHRRMGVGTALMNQIEREAARWQVSRVALHVISKREEARRMYERFGYRLWRPVPLFPVRTYLSRWSSTLSASLMIKSLERLD